MKAEAYAMGAGGTSTISAQDVEENMGRFVKVSVRQLVFRFVYLTDLYLYDGFDAIISVSIRGMLVSMSVDEPTVSEGSDKKCFPLL
jgi:hypothetical protein